MHEQYALSPADFDFLRDFLDSEANDNGLDFAGTHGFLTAVTVGPAFRDADAWLEGLFDEAPVSADAALSSRIQSLLIDWQRSIHATLYHGQPLALPCPLVADANESTPLTDWCVGFMEAMFAQEEEWYAQDEDNVADLTLPMVVISELIEDEEIAAIRRDKKILRELSQQIPDVITELYLLFHAPDAP